MKKLLNWILNRKKNISLSLILIPLFKVLTHFFLFPELQIKVIDGIGLLLPNASPEGLDYYFENMFVGRLELFIPVTTVFLIVVWFFNDKIKAQ